MVGFILRDLLLDFSTFKILLGDSVSWLKYIVFRVFPFFFFFVSSRLRLLIVAFVPVVFGFSVHLLGCHCPLSFGCAIFECGGVSVSTRSTLTTLVTLVSILSYL